MKSQIYLVQNCGGVSLEVVGGPFDPEAAVEIEEAIIQRVKADSGLRHGGDDTLHTLEIAPDGRGLHGKHPLGGGRLPFSRKAGHLGPTGFCSDHQGKMQRKSTPFRFYNRQNRPKTSIAVRVP